mmetsp:Transcript_10009/g.19250  ORF Transcript_10009/g.19250 Transcript_10009/m.19250 type:complete len:86 (+) Transcript_10009:129-386(+)
MSPTKTHIPILANNTTSTDRAKAMRRFYCVVLLSRNDHISISQAPVPYTKTRIPSETWCHAEGCTVYREYSLFMNGQGARSGGRL